LLQYGENCEGYAGHSFPLLPVLGSCVNISSGATVVRYLSGHSFPEKHRQVPHDQAVETTGLVSRVEGRR
jgi:hypothetical protein